jgi:hypothetical protein
VSSKIFTLSQKKSQSLKKVSQKDQDRKHKLIRPSEAKLYPPVKIMPIADLRVDAGDVMVTSDSTDWQIGGIMYQQFFNGPIYSGGHPAFDHKGNYGWTYRKKGIRGRYVVIVDAEDNVKMIILDNDDRNYY